MTVSKRKVVARVGLILISCSLVVTVVLWSHTCGLGGFHCFDGGYGRAVEFAQIGMVIGLICSLFGSGTSRLGFAAIAFAELAYCYRQLLVH
jgi:hypothetical protein